jgi:hypothetical protein
MINRTKMPRQLRNKGGIMTIGGGGYTGIPMGSRTGFGIISKIKDKARDLIPNEIASVASKAAPLVAPFFPGTAALMRGIGRFDQRGSISDALKQGIGTYAFGRGVGMLGGAQAPENFLGRQRFTRAGFDQGPIGRLFDRQAADPKVFGADDKLGGEMLTTGDKPSLLSKAGDVLTKGIKALPEGVAAQLVAGGLTAGASLLASYFQGEFREQEPGETIEDYLAARKVAVGKQMRNYMDNYFANDPEYMKLDDAGRDAFVARYNVRDGGMPTGIMRTNKAGVMERDYRDKGGFVPVGIKEKADDVPAMLSKNEFVMTADAVRGAGNGSIEKGAQKMYDTMKNLERRVV